MSRIFCFLFLISAAVLQGCSNNSGKLDSAERADPLLKKAAAKVEQGDVDGAVKLYNRALDMNSGLVRGHLDIALLLHDEKKDYVSAVYHYNRYLALRPKTEKRKMIENRIRLASQSYAGTLLGASGGNQPIIKELREKVEKLEAEIVYLEKKNGILKSKLLQKGRNASVVSSASGGVSTFRDRAKGKITYHVRAGDSLKSIAEMFYGDSDRWKEIKDANVKVINDPDHLIAGQVLNIP